MKNFKLKIHPKVNDDDFTIIYEDGNSSLYKIKMSKFDFLGKLQYYENQRNEINLTNVVYIQENIDFETFQEFISSIKNPEININDENLNNFLYLSHKYRYKELEEDLKSFIEERPDISQIIDDFLVKEKNSPKIDLYKEELIAKHLDISLQNQNMLKFPLPMLNRILNSPKKVIKNHHVLFQFVLKTIEEKKKEKMTKEDEENLLILPSCLDYLEMDNSEIERLFSIQEYDSFFKPKNSEEKIKFFIRKEEELTQRCNNLDNKIGRNEEIYKEQISLLELKIQNLQSKLIETINNFNSQLVQRIDAVEKNQQLFVRKEKELEDQIIEQKEKIASNETKIKEIKKESEKKAVSKAIICQNGIFEYLRSKSSGNIYNSKIIDVQTSFINDGNIKSLFDKSQMTHFRLSDKPDGFIIIDFIDRKVNFAKYYFSVPLKNTGNYTGRPKSWAIEGSNDGNSWEFIDEKQNDSSLNEYGKSNTFICQNITNNFYRFIKIKEIINHNDNHYFLLSEIEFFGSIE